MKRWKEAGLPLAETGTWMAIPVWKHLVLTYPDLVPRGSRREKQIVVRELIDR